MLTKSNQKLDRVNSHIMTIIEVKLH